MSRGNHESKNMNKMYGFEGEVIKKYDLKVFELFSDFFQRLPLSHCLNHKVLVLHGGLFSRDDVCL
jgi:serine/threonine-protein phosphatase 5